MTQPHHCPHPRGNTQACFLADSKTHKKSPYLCTNDYAMKMNVDDLPDGPFKDMDEMNEALAAHVQTVNNRPMAHFHGLSPAQMYLLLYQTFHPDSPLKVHAVSGSQLDHVPFFLLVVNLLQAVQAAGGFKATAKGNLPVAVCKELYAKKRIVHEHIEAGFVKANKEEDFGSVHIAHVVAKLMGLVRKLKGKILLTKKAEKLLLPANLPTLFGDLLRFYCKEYNWAYSWAPVWGFEDDQKNMQVAQFEMGYLLFLLTKFGDQDHTAAFYADECMKAFPILAEQLGNKYRSPMDELRSAIDIRFLDNFACWFGFAMVVGVHKKGHISSNIYRKTALLDEVFGFEL